jgi:hypothetical protein
MKTRTLLLLALACGLAIMLAGAVFFVQLVTQDKVEPAVALGTEVTIGDMRVVVEAADETGDVLDVTVRAGGVDDPDPLDEFRLIASGRAVEPEPGAGFDGACGALTESDQRCVIRFDVSGADGRSRVLFYERGDDRVRWVLA